CAAEFVDHPDLALGGIVGHSERAPHGDVRHYRVRAIGYDGDRAGVVVRNEQLALRGVIGDSRRLTAHDDGDGLSLDHCRGEGGEQKQSQEQERRQCPETGGQRWHELQNEPPPGELSLSASNRRLNSQSSRPGRDDRPFVNSPVDISSSPTSESDRRRITRPSTLSRSPLPRWDLVEKPTE